MGNVSTIKFATGYLDSEEFFIYYLPLHQIRFLSSTITVHNFEFEELISEREIAAEVEQMAREISHDYQEKDLVLVGVLNGVFMFFSDLCKSLTIDVPINFVKVASYIGQESSGKIRELVGFSGEIEGRDVLVVDDILDSGLTYEFLMDSIKVKKPNSVKFCSLLWKSEATKEGIKPDYHGFEIANEFVVGYGLDYNQLGRTYRSIYKKS